MTKQETIDLLGRRIDSLDVLRGDFEEGSEERRKLDRVRDDLDQRQQRLAAKAFEEQTARYKELTGQVKDVDGEIEAVIADVERFEQTLALVRRLISVTDELIGIGRAVGG